MAKKSRSKAAPTAADLEEWLDMARWLRKECPEAVDAVYEDMSDYVGEIAKDGLMAGASESDYLKEVRERWGGDSRWFVIVAAYALLGARVVLDTKE